MLLTIVLTQFIDGPNLRIFLVIAIEPMTDYAFLALFNISDCYAILIAACCL